MGAGRDHLAGRSANAAAYPIGIWDRLTRVVDDARIPLDNNAMERSIRGPVVGCNKLALALAHCTDVASRLNTIHETFKLRDVDPSAYLYAAEVAADRCELLLPWTFAARA